jgi:hypothetical protein|tara:strand:+ start:210 stop:332 length:123 start_codon:yes stop_codon:yes gene_type:complete
MIHNFKINEVCSICLANQKKEKVWRLIGKLKKQQLQQYNF